MFMSNVMAMINDRASVAQVADSFKVVYTPFHGCGWKLVPEALRGLGVKNLYCVEQQMVLDGTFPTVASPNPENPEGFYLAIELADKVGADFILGTDPDSDRVGIMVRGADGKFIAVTGNQTGVLLLDYLIGAMRRAGKMPEIPTSSRPSSPPRWPARWPRATASPAATRSPVSSSWPRRRTRWRPPARVTSSCPMRRATAICWATTCEIRTPSPRPC